MGWREDESSRMFESGLGVKAQTLEDRFVVGGFFDKCSARVLEELIPKFESVYHTPVDN
jgi:hypothetical protein